MMKKFFTGSLIAAAIMSASFAQTKNVLTVKPINR